MTGNNEALIILQSGEQIIYRQNSGVKSVAVGHHNRKPSVNVRCNDGSSKRFEATSGKVVDSFYAVRHSMGVF